MEYLYLFIASLLAGIGTGLAGLSAATVMVPILIVFCPSFSGPTGVYQATAIALLSDILASAFTSYIYIRNKNIDLRRGSIMLVCILAMSTLGSYVAYIVGNVVLGSFSLFLTFFIGIRFLVKPESGNPEATESTYTGFSIRDILISVFFGLTIGFGTGFVGTGGGMMMLVVFTLFLKMGQKTAVGTSTFIMTFTALIAGISHVFIEPSILKDNLFVLIFCLIVTALSSIFSARFANRVNEKLIGTITGLILTVLGAWMLILFYWKQILEFPFIANTIQAFGIYLGILFIYIVVILVLRILLRIPETIFRKLLHLVAVFTPILILYFSGSWLVTDLILLFFGVGAYLALDILEKGKKFSTFFAEKHEGEIKRSLVQYIGTCLILILVLGGFFKRDYLIPATFLMWGLGDAAAGIIGKYYGKKNLKLKGMDSNKTVLGTLAMFTVSFISGGLTLYYLSPFSLLPILILSFCASIAGTVVEAYCRKGSDTVFVPMAIGLTLLLFTSLFS